MDEVKLQIKKFQVILHRLPTFLLLPALFSFIVSGLIGLCELRTFLPHFLSSCSYTTDLCGFLGTTF